ncbi:titin isoform X2 [Toxorhynchites rutilus septentrionalis]|uniref:titin isoform X2 n=1 Tax=Toxorhynchites rutilus septentrionalis TaxID=329112 RepID=UPI00247AE401|nr:titin isoform X2 [Toxorhynchites rutilus septentrionalis]
MGNQPTKHSGRPKKAVHWKTAEPPSPPGKPTLVPGTPSDSTPDVVTLRWKRPTSDGGSPILGYIIEHRRTGSPHWVRATAQLIQSNELSITGLEPGWRYQFRVLAQNIVGQSESSELSEALTVTLQRAAVAPPRFINELFDTTAIENEKVEFRVSFVGAPAPQISWFKDGFEIFSSRRTKIITDNEISVLVIHQAALTDEGEIKCTATNRAGHTITICNLFIDAYPKIRLPRQYEDGVIVEADEVIRLKIGIAGQPTPIVEWSHNGELLSGGGRYEIETTDKNSCLRISNAQRSDRGEYHLRAFNKLGEDYGSFLVTVTSRPEPPGKISISMSAGKAVTLSWSAPEDDGGCKIGNYIVEYYRLGWDVWLKASTCRQLNTTLSGLIEGSQYRFRVKAENPYGLSDPGEESDTVFIPDPKRGINSATQIPERDENDNIPQVDANFRKRRDESRSPARDLDKVKKVKPFTQENYTRAEIVREMSYGTRDEDFFKIKQPESLREPSPPLAPPVQPQTQPPTPLSSSPPSVVITEPEPIETTPPQTVPARPPIQRPQSFNSPLKAMEKFTKETNHFAAMNSPSDSQLSPNPHGVLSDPTSPTTSDQGTIHNSSEFMLVLYNEREAKNNTRNSTFDFELDELVAPPPPLSLSAPELNVDPPPAPAMRPAVSSTELLYERAMARFYQAVAMEESENQRKENERRRSFGVVELPQAQQVPDHPPQQQQQQQTGPEATAMTRLADRRSSLRRRLSGDKEAIVKQSSFESDGRQHSSAIEEVIPEEKAENMEETVVEELAIAMKENKDDFKKEESIEEIDEDISNASSMDSMIEELKLREMSRSSRSQLESDDEEMDTYHPGQKLTSPYRNSDPSQAIEVLTKPLPMPDPNFVPKPILKRPSTEMLTKDEKKEKIVPSKPERKSLLNVFERKSPTKEERRPQPEKEKTPEVETTDTKQEAPLSEKQGPTQEEISIAIVAEVVRQKRLESRQNSEEESRAVADFYGEILERVETSKKPRKLPMYMSPDEVRKHNEKDRSRDTSYDRFVRSRSGSRSPLPVEEIYRVPKSRSPSLASESSVIKGKPARESKILRQRSASIDKDQGQRPPSVAQEQPPPVRILNRPEPAFSPGVVRDSRKRIVSKPGSRSNSAVRDAESLLDNTPNEAARRGKLRGDSNRQPSAPQQSTSFVIPPKPQNPPAPSGPTPPPSTPEPRSRSQSRTREPTPEETSLKSTLSHLTDVALFAIACWLYLFKNPKLAIPVIILIMYRHISDALRNRIPPWMKQTIS